jgi:protein SCO1/2
MKLAPFPRSALATLLVTETLVLLSPAPARSADCHPPETDGHQHHSPSAPGDRYLRSVKAYDVPDVTLVDRDGTPVSLASVLKGNQPILLNFIFTSCTTICPVMTATFAAVQRNLGANGQHPLLVSVSIDPEHDTPERLAEYAERQGARAPWHFLTGNSASIVRVQKAFDVYRGSKMNHLPVSFLRASPSEPWTRIEGFASSRDLVQEYGTLLAR